MFFFRKHSVTMLPVLCAILVIHLCTYTLSEDITLKKPTVFVAILVRNKAHTLPYFLTLFEKLEYPKERMYLWIRSDHNVDKSSYILRDWVQEHQLEYHNIDSSLDMRIYSNPLEEVGHWSDERYSHIIMLRENAITTARKLWADYILFLDADVLLTNAATLTELISKKMSVVGPMLKSDGIYSNFWCGMTEKFYYKRTPEYEPIISRKNVGCHEVPMVHTCVLINLNAQKSDSFTFVPIKLKGYNGPHDDIITFALSTNFSGVPIHVCNDQNYGYVTVPLERDTGLDYDEEQLINIKLQAAVDTDEPLGFPVSSSLSRFLPPPSPPDRLSLDSIYVINLERRPERKNKMVATTRILNLEVSFVKAVDGRKLNDKVLADLGVTMMHGYADPYHKRPMKKGEIGCFLSHYNIWNEVVEKKHDIVMVLEDDVRFESFFKQKLATILKDLKSLPAWDLIYLGRKKLSEKPEPTVAGSRYLVEASYSYWTLGYLLSGQGARKLTEAQPLSNMLPVDEFLPLLAGNHFEKKWEQFYPLRDLITWSAQPLLLYPVRYLNEAGYVSDTEDSPVAIGTADPTVIKQSVSDTSASQKESDTKQSGTQQKFPDSSAIKKESDIKQAARKVEL